MKYLLSSNRARWMTYSASLLAATGLIVLVLMVETSSQPQFCGSCHIMAPYYESWKTSSHRDVPCVDCHISPGITHEIRKKWEALSMVTSYVTGTYGTNPWAEIDDAACLRCHQRRLLAGEELFGDVLFNHGPHLTELRHGKKLRCTSCHSQIVQGQHISVTSPTCILCHFKGETTAVDTTRCTLCHTVPERTVEKGMVSFNHGDVKRFDMKCEWCHSQASGPLEGTVPRERCFTCHNESARLEQYDQHQKMHQVHVTDHKVDCLNCHLEIQHGKPWHAEAAAAESGCGGCHRSGHSPQRSLYAGVGGRGVPPMPAPMFLAGVACEGCHIQLPGHEADTARATEISCMSCHGPRYHSVYQQWKAITRDRTSALRMQLQSTTSLFPAEEPPSLSDARYNLELVEKGKGVHNLGYSFALLQESHRLINEARKNKGSRPLSIPWPEVPYSSPCLKCHQGIELQEASAFGQRFSHESHVVGHKLECDVCHRPHEERTSSEVLRFGSEGCAACHHKEKEADCRQCHSAIMEDTVPSFRGDFAHFLHVEMTEECLSCHSIEKGQIYPVDRETCSICH